MLNLDSASIAHTVVKTGAETKTGKLMARNPFYPLLGDCYTIVVRARAHVRAFSLLNINGITSLNDPKQEG